MNSFLYSCILLLYLIAPALICNIYPKNDDSHYLNNQFHDVTYLSHYLNNQLYYVTYFVFRNA